MSDKSHDQERKKEQPKLSLTTPLISKRHLDRIAEDDNHESKILLVPSRSNDHSMLHHLSFAFQHYLFPLQDLFLGYRYGDRPMPFTSWHTQSVLVRSMVVNKG